MLGLSFYVLHFVDVHDAIVFKSSQTIEDLERELLNGQKLQGPPTAAEVNAVLTAEGTTEK